MVDSFPRYIWANFDYDIVRIRTYYIPDLADDSAVRDSIRHLQGEIDDRPERSGHELEDFSDSKYSICDFTNLESCCILVDHKNWDVMTDILAYKSIWGKILEKNVRMVDSKTGEWVVLESCDAYRDYLDTVVAGSGLSYRPHPNMLLGQSCTKEEWDVDDQKRLAAIERLQIPLPRMDMDAWLPTKSRRSSSLKSRES